MAQPYLGRTVIEIAHPDQDLSWRSPSNLAEVVSRLRSMLSASASGSTYPTTVITVGQGGTRATGTITLTNVGGTAAAGSISYSGASGTTTATVNGVAFAQTTGTDTARAIALAAAITASTNPAIQGVVTAVRAGDDVDITAVEKGTDGNTITLAVSGTGIARSAATLANGQDGLVDVTVGYATLVSTNTTNLSDSAAAAALASDLNADEAVSSIVTASAASNVVTLTAVSYGTASNNIGVASNTNTGTAVVSGGGLLAGGTEPTTFSLRRP